MRRCAGAVGLGCVVLTTACASTGAVPRPFPIPSGPSAAGLEASAPDVAPLDGYGLVGTALSLRGVPYKNGGADTGGFDCSGFTQYVYGQYGISLPREVRDQYERGRAVKSDDLRPGDLLFFTTTAPGASHVAIAIGGDQFVHAPSSTGAVRVERLSTRYWSLRYLGARRVDTP